MGRLLLGMVLVLVAACAQALPERPHFRHFGIAQGMPAFQVNGIAQDRAGYLWFATSDGLARFDGHEWTVHRHEPDDPGSMPGNAVLALFIDRDDAVWVAIEGMGLARLGPGREGFEHFLGDGPEHFGGPYVFAIHQTPDGDLWVGTFRDGLFRRAPDGTVRRYAAEDGSGLPGEVVLGLEVDAAGVLWVATERGVVRFDGERFQPSGSPLLDTAVVGLIRRDGDDNLWFGRRGGAVRLSPDGRWRQFPGDGAFPQMVTTGVDVGRGAHWLLTAQGVYVQAGADLRFGAFRDPVLARANLVAILKDREGSLWLGGNGGAWQLPPGWRRFSVFGAGELGGGLVNDMVRVIAPAADGGIWLGGADGLDHLDVRSGRVRHVPLPPEVPDRLLWSMAEAGAGRLWLGLVSGLARWDPGTGALERWRFEAQGEGGPDFMGPTDLLHLDGDGRLWVGVHGGGVQVRDADTGSLILAMQPGSGHGVHHPDPEQIGPGPDGDVWLADAAGLSRFDEDLQRFVPVQGGPDGRVYTFAAGPGGRVWLHRMAGLEAYRWRDGRLHREQAFGSAQGLPAVESGGLVLDREGGVWLTTSRGLAHVDGGGGLRVYGVRDGLPGQEFTTRPIPLLDSGIGVASLRSGGVVLFDPAVAEPEPAQPPVQVVRATLRRGDRSVRLDPGQPLRLQHGDRDLRIAVRLLSFLDPDGHAFRMRLSGHDEDWVAVPASGERMLPMVSPGEHRIQVQGRLPGGDWGPVLGLDVVSVPPWWGSGAAKAGYLVLVLALLGLSGLAYRRRLRRLHQLDLAEQRRMLAEQASRAKTDFLANLGHEIRTPMTGVMGMSELLLREELPAQARGRVRAIHKAGEHLLRLVNDALDLARVESGHLQLEEVAYDPAELVREVCELLRPMAAGKGLGLRCEVPEDLPAAVLGDVHRIRQILLNLAQNAVKFTGRGHVTVAVRAGDGSLVYRVADTGPGMTAEQQARLFRRFEPGADGHEGGRSGAGLGLAISQELAVAMGGRIELRSRVGQGTLFTVVLPCVETGAVQSGSAAGDATAGGAPDDGLDVLLVEDDATAARAVGSLLESLGHRVQHAAHGLAALTLVASSRVDVALVDLDLPGLHGFELVRLLRLQGHRLPVAAITARGDGDAEDGARRAGMIGLVHKPVTRAALEQVVTALAAARGDDAPTPGEGMR